MTKRIIAVILIYLATSVAWMGLGVLTEVRTRETYRELHGAVGELWGTAHSQPAPEVYALVPKVDAEVTEQADVEGPSGRRPREPGWDVEPSFEGASAPGTSDDADFARVPVALASSDVHVSFDLDHRKKGLLWFSTYAVDFDGSWRVLNPYAAASNLLLVFRFPTPLAIYDDFSFLIDGREAQARRGADGSLEAVVTAAPGETVSFSVGYRSRGLDSWTYRFGSNVTQVRDFTLTMETDFKDIDFPSRTISPTLKEETAEGWRLVWRHENLVSGFQVGLEMPQRLNPGPLASRISFFAPVSLLFFFFVIFVLGVLRGVDLHPMHYFFLAAAFFSFHLLFAYLVDHIDVHLAFVVSSLVSVALVVSYLRLVVSSRFAFVEAGLAQLLYLVLFSYTHFLEGFTGLTVTVGAILTLFVLMQATAKVDWNRVFGATGAGTAGSDKAETS